MEMLRGTAIEPQDAQSAFMDESFIHARLPHLAVTASTAALELALDAVQMLPLVITIGLEGNCRLEPYKGSTFHGGFGRGLAHAAPEVAARFFLLGDDQQSRPFAIEPPSSERTEFDAGELLSFRITLFGPAVAEGPALVAALKAWGEMGLGPQRTPFSLVDLAVSAIHGAAFSLAPTQLADLASFAAPLSAWLSQQQTQQAHWQSVLVQAETRLRLQHHGELLLQAPTAQQLRAAVARRLAAVAAMAVPELRLDARVLLANQPSLDGCELVADHSRFADWQRYSRREERHQPLGGLLGGWRYAGDVAQLLPWLEIGQWLLLGNKTTFGFGRYRYTPGY